MVVVMASTFAWLVAGIALVAISVPMTIVVWRKVSNPELLAAAVDDAVAGGRDIRSADARRAGMRWPVVTIPGIWFLALLSWPRTIDHVIRGEWNVITSGEVSAWAQLAYYVILGGLALCVILGFSLYYWNWPKIFVHPYFRQDPGYLAATHMRADGVDVDAIYEASAARWRSRQSNR
jgi:hypothetical protein